MPGQYEELSCPFCDKGRIACLYFPGALSVKRSGSISLPGKASFHRSSDNWIIQSGCSLCRKSQDEVEKKLKENDII